MQCIPGNKLCLETDYKAGIGCYEQDGIIYSSILGFAFGDSNERTMNVIRRKPSTDNTTIDQENIKQLLKMTNVIPQVGSIIAGRITRINSKQASVDIIICGDHPLPRVSKGLLRSVDVRTTDKDRCKIQDWFRPGDLIRAQIVKTKIQTRRGQN